MAEFYELAKEHIATIGGMIDKISKSTDMREISELEVKIRKLSAETMVYAGMIPNKDVYPITLQRRKFIQSDAVKAINRVKEVLAEEPVEEPAEEPVKPKAKGKKKAPAKKSKTSKKKGDE